LRLKIVKLSHIASCIVDVGRHRFFLGYKMLVASRRQPPTPELLALG
jgi:hypothetical protein